MTGAAQPVNIIHPVMSRLVYNTLKNAMLAALMFALLALPFVHRAGAEPVSAEITQFISMGGDLADICGERGDHKAGGCESCNIAAAMMLPLHARLLHPAFTPTPLDPVIIRGTDAPLPAPHATPPVRAPPARMT